MRCGPGAVRSLDELASALVKFQSILDAAGNAPGVEGQVLRRLVRLMIPGINDQDYAALDSEIADFLAEKTS